MEKGIQTFFLVIGENACYIFSLIKIAEKFTAKVFDPLQVIQNVIGKGYVGYNKNNPDDKNNMYVNYPELILEMLTGKKWTVEKVDDCSYEPKQNEFVVQRWENVTTKGTYSHFRLPDWDSLFDSQTVKQGKLVSLRIFRLK